MNKSENERCYKCRKTVTEEEDGLLFDGCLRWSHRQCFGLSIKTYQKLSKSQESWYCEICKNEESRKPPPQQSPKNYTLNDVIVMTKLEEMDKKYNSLFKHYSEQITINEELKREVSILKTQINTNEQKELNKNIIIQSEPYEDVKSKIKKISEELQIGLSEDQFTAFTMVKDTSKNCPIINEQIKKDILRSKSETSLTTQKIGFRTASKIFINHDLTKSTYLSVQSPRRKEMILNICGLVMKIFSYERTRIQK
ncbi:hypothetical protein WA026_021878 [Henosepilachna vigintioctopunctata]|uniref:PHD-type domain-containing protein n=1 Tax=Henosepilachna vigintioctopunctata TaxID=420089 RepID=A0AAW1UP48_9CUCU